MRTGASLHIALYGVRPIANHAICVPRIKERLIALEEWDKGDFPEHVAEWRQILGDCSGQELDDERECFLTPRPLAAEGAPLIVCTCVL